MAPETTAPDNMPVDLPDLSAYRPVPAEKAGEGETTVSKETDRSGAETESTKETTDAAPGNKVSTSHKGRRQESGSPAPARGREERKTAPIDRSPVTPPHRGIYAYLALGIVVLLGGAALAALVWRITYTPSKKGISKGEKRR